MKPQALLGVCQENVIPVCFRSKLSWPQPAILSGSFIQNVHTLLSLDKSKYHSFKRVTKVHVHVNKKWPQSATAGDIFNLSAAESYTRKYEE